ncbi:MAG: methylmalonyl Co-A mutase-associated GTPase MeaB [Tissierellia bacterium]|nr:methylmalonyl Co-A mutase-associated GTPase MeaB [Tissierellia bacterium]
MNIDEKLLKGDKRACARLITMLESNDKEAIEILKNLYKNTGKAYVIGVTGPPGAGKSTLTDKLVKELRKQDKKVGIIAIDPTSPFSGGAILGDRIRMNDLSLDKNIFIRSMGTRGSLGGMSRATWGAVKVLDIFGCDYIFIETVGVGQSEVDIVKTADTVLMVMVPNLGDDIQAIKAGIMEIADVFAINKSDLDGADKTELEVEMNLDLNEEMDFRPPVVKVSAAKNKDIDKLLEKIIEHRTYLEETNKLEEKRIRNNKTELLKMVEEDLMSLILDKAVKEDLLENLAREVTLREKDPYTAKEEILKLIVKSE